MSDFKFACPHCQQKIGATPEYAGLQINCPGCQAVIVVPENPAAPAAAGPAKGGKLAKSASTVEHAATTPAAATATVRKAKKPKKGLYIGIGVAVAVAVAAVIFVPKAIDKYNEHKEAVAAAAVAAAAPPPPPPDLEAPEILQKVDEVYKGFPSYSAQASSVGTFELIQPNPMMKGPIVMSAKLSMLMGRPNYYRFEWDRQMGPTSMKGAVWSAGKGDFIRTGKAPTKVKDREAATTTAGATSGTLGPGLADLFFATTNRLETEMKNCTKSPNETLDGHKCYVLAGEVESQNMVLWIHKDDFLIAQAKVIFSGKIDEAAMAKMNAAQKAQAKMMQKMKGDITETYSDIQTNKNLTADAFQSEFTPTATPREKRPGGPADPTRKKKRE